MDLAFGCTQHLCQVVKDTHIDCALEASMGCCLSAACTFSLMQLGSI